MSPTPKVSIGMPVFNGDRFLEEAFKSILMQTFCDFELIISDNASTDRTLEICQAYAAKDPRIHYYRNDRNLGYSFNQNRVIELADGKYFLHAHHDDVRSPEYLQRTVEVLESDPSVVICYSITKDIDEVGNILPRTDPELRFDSLSLRARFSDVIRMDHICEPDFGLMRNDILKRTTLHGKYADSDRVLLAELALYGRFFKLQDQLFFRRCHSSQSTAVAPDRRSRTRVWFNPDHESKFVFPHFRQLTEYLAVINRAPISLRDRFWCRLEILRWVNANRARLLSDIQCTGVDIARPLWRAVRW
jgi:glycosyltransferase involved in cell wall biosynthesis